MPTIAEQLTQLTQDRNDLVDNLTTKGITGLTGNETFTELVPEVLNITTVPAEAEEKDINFYDYDGFRIASWTLDELSNKTELPENPMEHDGLIFQEWNWTLQQLKDNNSKTCVGALYKTDDDSTRLYLDIPDNNNSININLKCPSGTQLVISWGDDTTDNYTGTGSGVVYSHTYTNKGKYVISIKIPNATSSTYLGFMGNNPSSGNKSNFFGEITSSNYYKFNFLYKVELSGTFLHQLNSCVFNRFYNLRYFVSSTQTDNPGSYTFYDCEGLKVIILPQRAISVGNYCFSTNQALEYACLPYTCTSIKTEAFRKCYVLKEISVPYRTDMSISDYAFASCNCLKNSIVPPLINVLGYTYSYNYFMSSLTIPDTIRTIQANAFLNCYGLKEIHFKRSTPPTLGASNAFSGLPTTCKIYIPLGTYSAYTSAAYYPSKNTYTYIEEE